MGCKPRGRYTQGGPVPGGRGRGDWSRGGGPMRGGMRGGGPGFQGGSFREGANSNASEFHGEGHQNIRGGGRGGFERGGIRGGRGSFTRGRASFHTGNKDGPILEKGTPIKTKLHVRNIKEGVTADEVRELFGNVGKVLECAIVRDFAFVHFGSAEEANQALLELDGTELRGQNIEIKISKSNLRQTPGMSKDCCFRCGSLDHWSNECPFDEHSIRGGMRGGRGGRGTSDRGGAMHPRGGRGGRGRGDQRYSPYGSRRGGRQGALDSPFPPYDPNRRDPYYRRMRLKKLEQAYRKLLLEIRAEELGIDPNSDDFIEDMAGIDTLQEPLKDPLEGILAPLADPLRQGGLMEDTDDPVRSDLAKDVRREPDFTETDPPLAGAGQASRLSDENYPYERPPVGFYARRLPDTSNSAPLSHGRPAMESSLPETQVFDYSNVSSSALGAFYQRL